MGSKYRPLTCISGTSESKIGNHYSACKYLSILCKELCAVYNKYIAMMPWIFVLEDVFIVWVYLMIFFLMFVWKGFVELKFLFYKLNNIQKVKS